MTTRVRLNLALYVLAVIAVCAVVLLGVLSWQAYDDRRVGSGRDAVTDLESATYREVLTAAKDEVTAFVNLDYRDLDPSIEAVKAGATGEFAEQYEASTQGLRDLMARNQSVMTGQVLSAGIVAADKDSATVLVATKGNVVNVSTKGQKQERNQRIQLELTRVDGRWLTSNLEFVG